MVTILIMGDICPEWGFPEQFATGIAENVFRDLFPVLNKADYVVANLEAPATSSTQKANKNSICLKANQADIKVLRNAGINAVALANNHILDYGVNGLTDTFQILSENGIAWYGAGTIEKAKKPHIIVLNGIRLGFMAFAEREFNCAVDYGVGANLWNDLDSIVDIHHAKQECDFLVVQYHGGIEHNIYPSPYLQKKCRAMAEAGADFITCQHSHCIGTREEWNGSEILYGQGNCIFGYEANQGEQWNHGVICQLELNRENRNEEAGEISRKIQYIPISAAHDGEYLANPSKANQILETIRLESKKITEPMFIRDNWIEFCHKQASTYLPMQFGWNINMIRANKLLGGKIVKMLVRPNQKRNAMNLIRCDAHREVVTTILTEEYEKDSFSRRNG